MPDVLLPHDDDVLLFWRGEFRSGMNFFHYYSLLFFHLKFPYAAMEMTKISLSCHLQSSFSKLNQTQRHNQTLHSNTTVSRDNWEIFHLHFVCLVKGGKCGQTELASYLGSWLVVLGLGYTYTVTTSAWRSTFNILVKVLYRWSKDLIYHL